MLSAIKHVVDAIFFFQQHSVPMQFIMMVHAAQFSCCSTKLHFFYSYGPSSPEMNSTDYSIRFMESRGITNFSCKSAILKISSSNWLNSGKPLTQHLKDAIFAFPCFFRQTDIS